MSARDRTRPGLARPGLARPGLTRRGLTRPGPLYQLLNAAFHGAHCAIILFAMLGWTVPALLPFHLTLIGLTLTSWFVLGRWLGQGYCPISDWHWRLKAVLGEGKPAGSYIFHVLRALGWRTLDAARLDTVVLVGTVSLAALSLGLNLLHWMGILK